MQSHSIKMFQRRKAYLHDKGQKSRLLKIKSRCPMVSLSRNLEVFFPNFRQTDLLSKLSRTDPQKKGNNQQLSRSRRRRTFPSTRRNSNAGVGGLKDGAENAGMNRDQVDENEDQNPRRLTRSATLRQSQGEGDKRSTREQDQQSKRTRNGSTTGLSNSNIMPSGNDDQNTRTEYNLRRKSDRVLTAIEVNNTTTENVQIRSAVADDFSRKRKRQSIQHNTQTGSHVSRKARRKTR
ncbi:hypothetical protein BJ742DRAFT_814793 [Cladochytrium replicatum]|nr:hypothetical protein BJ742DRAFT_814793 [Cladochytrium replicatum]